jgi:hypothetical protein
MNTSEIRNAVKNGKRAERRAHRDRKIRHARSIFTGGFYGEHDDLGVHLRAWAERNHDHLLRCMCHLCNNRRAQFGATVQEKRSPQWDAIGEFEDEIH